MKLVCKGKLHLLEARWKNNNLLFIDVEVFKNVDNIHSQW